MALDWQHLLLVYLLPEPNYREQVENCCAADCSFWWNHGLLPATPSQVEQDRLIEGHLTTETDSAATDSPMSLQSSGMAVPIVNSARVTTDDLQNETVE